jgi:hypothetical protein
VVRQRLAGKSAILGEASGLAPGIDKLADWLGE